MISQFKYIGKCYLFLLVLFVAFKPLFMIYNLMGDNVVFIDFLQVVYHGLQLDLSTVSYVTALPLLSLLPSMWLNGNSWWHWFIRIYWVILSFLIAIILVADCALYAFWGFKIDATIFHYLDNPTAALSSVSAGFVCLGVVIILLVASLLVFVLCKSIPQPIKSLSIGKRLLSSMTVVLLAGTSFVVMRGGLDRSTMNIGKVYYSDQPFLNHSAVNPAFSLMASAFKTPHFDKMHRFYSDQEVQQIFASAAYSAQSVNSASLLTTTRPNILLVIMEGFGAMFIESLGGKAGVTPQFNNLAREGIFFTQCYANSFRTDRGTLCTLSGYPSFPKVSPMKVPEKSRALGSIASALQRVGYSTEFLYGGDENFTNMKSYLYSVGFQRVLGQNHFPSSVRRTHAWGVTDAIAFDTLYQRLVQSYSPTSSPRFTTFLTLASHEPWKVPFHRSGLDEKANSMAYVDDCLGKFVSRMKQSPLWKNLLIICIPDHGISYPEGLTEANPQRNHIPMLWIGGAVRQPVVFSQPCNQSDLLATLLAQLQLPHQDFPFSRDLFDESYTNPIAMHTFDNGFSLIDSTGYSVFDLTSMKPIAESPSPSANRIALGKAILQTQMHHFAHDLK